MPQIITRRLFTPVGTMVLGSVADRLCLCDWDIPARRATVDRRLHRFFGGDMVPGTSPVIEQAMAQIDEYFRDGRKEFDVQLTLVGTQFQYKVWKALLDVPYGSLESYSSLARRIGSPKAVRAVASAVGANPISIILPCHRIAGADGLLRGYAGGLAAKFTLLRLEGAITEQAE